jgi:hypothetical protein
LTRFRLGTAACLACVGILFTPGAGLAADPPFKISSADGKSSLTFGFLVQPQLEVQTTADGADTSQSLFLRRVRLIFGGQATEKLTFFIDTDSTNLGKDSPSGQKIAENVFLQDVILTYAFRGEFQVDAGMLLFPLSHNTGQSAATLLAIDYGPYSFLASEPTGSRIGRDYGIQARGYVLSKHVEYRLGAFQGYADPKATAPFRYAARVVWYPFEAETGFFYSGTNLGTRRILAIGAGLDRQDRYAAVAVDAYYDQPLPAGNAFTLQADSIRYNGRRTFLQVPEQNTWLVEAGYYHKRTRLGPWTQLAGRDFPAGDPGETKVLAGLAYWAAGHRFNIKAGGGQLSRQGSPTRTQFVVQGQFFWY